MNTLVLLVSRAYGVIHRALRMQRGNNRGISIMEVLVSVMIITLGMVGVLSLVIQNIRVQYINKNVLVASGLAQEGLELVRNVRDLNWLTLGNDWKLGTGAYSSSDIVQDGDYFIDYYYGITDVDGISNARLYTNNTSGFYTHTSTGATATNFYRLITVVDNTNYLDLRCTIRWTEGNQNREYTAETYLFNWR